MKFRQGFVSNSSSTSFIIALPEVPSSPGDVKKMLFSDRSQGFTMEGGITVNQDMIAGFIFGQVEGGQNGPNSMSYLPNMISMMEYGVSTKQITHKGKMDPRAEREVHDRNEVERYQAALDRTRAFMKRYPGWRYYFVDAGCQTSFAHLFKEDFKRLFKNIGYVFLGDL